MMKSRVRTGEKLAVVPNGIRYKNATTAITVLFFDSIEGIPRTLRFRFRSLLLSLFMTRQPSWFNYENDHHNDEYNDVLKKWNKI
jgi:hypothetical protein